MNRLSIQPRITHLHPRHAAKIAGLAVSLFIAVYLVRQIDLNDFLRALAGLPALSVVSVFSIYMVLNLLRALRFHVLLGLPTQQLRVLYPIALYHNFLARVLPFKTGEVSYVVMVRHYMKQPIQEGVVSLVCARLFDLLIVA